jgi:hypothetical protein
LQIDPVYLLQPAVVLAISLGLLVYWWRSKGFRGAVLALSFGAYWLAIVLKGVVNYGAYNAVVAAFGYASIGTGLYFGLQTTLLEVGLAYLFARYGVKRSGFAVKDSVSYGLGLSFWENGVYLGALSLFNLVVIYLLLSMGGGLAATVSSQLPTGYFASEGVALQSVALGTLERISSMMAHTSWGVLCVLAAATRKRRFLAVALPMGLIDAAVPFAGQVGAVAFEAGVFLVSLGFLGIAWLALRSVNPDQSGDAQNAIAAPDNFAAPGL